VAVVLNEEAVKMLGWDDPIGKKLHNFFSNQGIFTVIGVIKDYHYESTHQKIRPMALFHNDGYYQRGQNLIAVRFAPENISDVLNYVEKRWKEATPGVPFNYSYLDEEFGKLYLNEQKTQQVLAIFCFRCNFYCINGIIWTCIFHC